MVRDIKIANFNETYITAFRRVFEKESNIIRLSMAFDRIKNGKSKTPVLDAREAADKGDKGLKNQIKESNLPVFAFGAQLDGRTTLIKGSGLACLDFDTIEDMQDWKDKLSQSEYIMALWLSPGGKGYKALVRIPIIHSKGEYGSYYQALLKHFKELEPDTCPSAFNSLCYESYDPDLYLNPQSKVFTDKIESNNSTFLSPSTTFDPLGEKDEYKVLDWCLTWWRRKVFDPEARNESIFKLACALNEYGVSKDLAEQSLLPLEGRNSEGDLLSQREIIRTVRSAYNRTVSNSKIFTT